MIDKILHNILILFERIKAETTRCYVCNKTFGKGEERIPIGCHKYRHKKCRPGSKNWMKNIGDSGIYYKYFDKQREINDGKKNNGRGETGEQIYSITGKDGYGG